MEETAEQGDMLHRSKSTELHRYKMLHSTIRPQRQPTMNLTTRMIQGRRQKSSFHSLTNLSLPRVTLKTYTEEENEAIRSKHVEYSKICTQNLWNTKGVSNYPTAKDIYNKYKTLTLKIKKTLSAGEITMRKEESHQHKLVVLEEGKERKLIILEGETQYCKIHVGKKPAPLILTVEAIEGSYEIYASAKIRKPNQNNCEKLVRIEGNDKTEYVYNSKYKRFQAEEVYLAISAFSHVVLRVKPKFGRAEEGGKVRCEINEHPSARASMILKINAHIKMLCNNAGLLKELNKEVGTLFI
eukprot:TRINITY_DN105070_c1_g1_i1.p1 TRINITY_DN105070_c1_g1~~TRINITY_DN105070_c1_g1_i1.p1  ORF type:complete len:328 (-),score=22.74 TRINITY_DN105070_c1_g1_i1:1850-2743(-)